MCNQQLTHAARTCSLQIAHVNLWLFAHLYNTNSLLFSTIYTKYYQETLLLLASTAAKMAVSWLKGSCSLKGPCHVPNFIWCCQQHSFWRREHRWRRWWAWISSSSVNFIRGTGTCRGSCSPRTSQDMDGALKLSNIQAFLTHCAEAGCTLQIQKKLASNKQFLL